MAEVMRESPLVVLQNIYIVKGKAGFSAQFMIARANASGLFSTPIDWRVKGKGDTLEVEAFSILKSTGAEVSFTASMAMAKAEGWTSNAKYRSMPELMLRYRSATFLVRLYAPQVLLGYQTAEELDDAAYAARTGGTTITIDTETPAETGRAALAAALDTPAHDPETGEVEAEPQEAEPTKKRRPATGGWKGKFDRYCAAVEAADSVDALLAAQSEHSLPLNGLKMQQPNLHKKAAAAYAARMEELAAEAEAEPETADGADTHDDASNQPAEADKASEDDPRKNAYDAAYEALTSAATIIDLNSAWSEHKNTIEALPDEAAGVLQAAFLARRDELKGGVA